MTIEEARKQKGMTRRGLSDWLGIPYRTLTNWENGSRTCPDYVERLIVEKIMEKYETARKTIDEIKPTERLYDSTYDMYYDEFEDVRDGQ